MTRGWRHERTSSDPGRPSHAPIPAPRLVGVTAPTEASAMSAATKVEAMNLPLALRRARKDHVCEPCGHTIRKGHIYCWWTWFGDVPIHVKAHQICAVLKVDGEYLGLDTDGYYGVSLGEDQWDGLAEEFGPFPFDPWDAQGDQITEVMSWFSVSS